MLPGEAYAKFGRRRKRVDESIEAYLADLRRLLRMAGHKIADDGKDPMLLEQFLVGLPAHYAGQLRLSIAASTDGLMIDAVANQARALCASGLVPSDGHGMVAAVASSSSRSSSSASQVCFFCQEVGHLRKDCPKRKERIRCYQCKENGHIQRNCPRQMQRKADSANAVVDRPSQDRCLALRAAAGVSLPRIYVDARGCTERLKAAVDSCSNRSLISVETARSHDIEVMPVNGDCPITAIDGSLLAITGVAKLTIARDDEFVYLP